MNNFHEAFLHDWLVSFLYQTVLSHARHDGKSIHDKFTKGYSYLYNKQIKAEASSIIAYS